MKLDEIAQNLKSENTCSIVYKIKLMLVSID